MSEGYEKKFDAISGRGAPLIDSFTVSPSFAEIAADETQQFTALAHYSDGRTLDVTLSCTWSTSDDDVASVDALTGLVIGIVDGVAVIRAQLGAIESIANVEVTGGVFSGPVVDSYSPDHGEITASIEITGANFTSATSVSFNGAFASFAVIDDNAISAVVPNGATTGAVSVTSPDGTGIGPSFTVDANNFAFDLTTTSLPADLTASRTGDTLYAQRSAAAVVAVSGADCFEDRADGRGGGHWVFAGYYNAAKPFNFAEGQAGPNGNGWDYQGTTPAVTPAAAVAPDGTTTASLIEDASAGAAAHLRCDGNDGTPTAITDIVSVWVKDPPSGAPTVPGGFSPRFDGGNPMSLGVGETWRRVITEWTKNGIDAYEYIDIYPAGAQPDGGGWASGNLTFTLAAVGGSYFWGAQAARSLTSPPLVDGQTGDLTIDFDPTNVLNANGDLHIEGAFLTLGADAGPQWDPANGGSDQAPVDLDAQCLVSMDTPNGETALYRGQQLIVNGYINGVTVIGGITLALNTGALQISEFRWELWNRPSVGDSGMQIWINGCRFSQIVCPGSLPQAQPTTGYLGHRNGTKLNERRHTLLRKTTRNPDLVEGVVLGDSIMSVYSSGMPAVGTLIYTTPESRSRDGIVSYALAGDTVQGQQTKFDASAQLGAAGVKWFIVQVGVNNVIADEDAATVIGRLQALVDDINTNDPGAKILLGQITPCRASVGDPKWTIIQAVNAAIAGSGGTPITGSNIIRVPAWTALDDGTGNLAAADDLGDGLHTNLIGRHYQASVYRAQLVANGLL